MAAKYDRIGVDYNVTRKADPSIIEGLLKHLQPKSEGVYLDIGCGTGNYTLEFEKKGFQFIGIDPSVEMLKKARQKSKTIDWRIGTAEKIELLDNSVNGVIGSLTIHHWTDLQKGFQEIHRVLKSNGRIVIFTSTPKQMNGYWLNHYFPKMLAKSMLQMPSIQKVQNAMKSNGIEIVEIEKIFIEPDLQDKFLYCGKQNPELYFDESIRNGISSFSSLANKEEVKDGLSKLRADIDNGRINEIMKSFVNDFGDYLYIVGEKAHI